MLFLIEYDRDKGELVTVRQFDDAQRTVAENARIEREVLLHREGIEREIVLLEAASQQDLRRTHGRYFKTLEALASRDPA
jgi:hypothetical protein